MTPGYHAPGESYDSPKVSSFHFHVWTKDENKEKVTCKLYTEHGLLLNSSW